MRKFLIVFLVMTGCQTATERREALVKDRTEKLKSLTPIAPQTCLVMATLTAPALARYRELFANDALDGRALTYEYHVRPTSCRVEPMEPSETARNFNAFLTEAFCMMVQTHFVNSPFAALEFTPKDIEAREDKVHIRSGPTGDLGLYLSPDTFTLETRTKSRGLFRALYATQDKFALPLRLEHNQPRSLMTLDEFKFEFPRGAGRASLRGFDLAAGEKAAVKQARVDVSDCRPE